MNVQVDKHANRSFRTSQDFGDTECPYRSTEEEDDDDDDGEMGCHSRSYSSSSGQDTPPLTSSRDDRIYRDASPSIYPSSPMNRHRTNHHSSVSPQARFFEEDNLLHSLEDRFPFLKEERKRTRKLLTPDQTRVLEAILQKTVYPSTPLREAVARQLGIPPRKVQIWFQNKRQSRRRVPSVSDAARSFRLAAHAARPRSSSITRDLNFRARSNSVQTSSSDGSMIRHQNNLASSHYHYVDNDKRQCSSGLVRCEAPSSLSIPTDVVLPPLERPMRWSCPSGVRERPPPLVFQELEVPLSSTGPTNSRTGFTTNGECYGSYRNYPGEWAMRSALSSSSGSASLPEMISLSCDGWQGSTFSPKTPAYASNETLELAPIDLNATAAIRHEVLPSIAELTRH